MKSRERISVCRNRNCLRVAELLNNLFAGITLYGVAKQTLSSLACIAVKTHFSWDISANARQEGDDRGLASPVRRLAISDLPTVAVLATDELV
ncbi:hypothetical protein Fuma_00033 [Fuerstiella marisgermanici]|uniref:Uncharacterized protein n=1 Tax=Fuerstiella marisgermanici TaxID=1891926 RepID=A0A1P8W8S6_9PLAN|nr:hypothetical protein Fuma_00033 [Fuerstiella marisgermanici]